VPASHAAVQALPAVSGSSGRLVVSPLPAAPETKTYPGQVFANPDLDYGEAMSQYITARQAQTAQPAERPTPAPEQAQRQVLRQKAEALRIARRQEREKRRQQAAAWRQICPERQAQVAQEKAQSRQERQAKRQERQAALARWQAQKRVRQEQLAEQKIQDAAWRQERQRIRQALAVWPVVVVWMAILVIVDNATRQCLGLPLFVAGPHVTAALVSEALRELLPPELRYLLADGGVHFTAKEMQALAQGHGFVRVPLPRHRPCTNGIAERFVRRLKEWLEDKTWCTAAELTALLACFLQEYNHSPHQGRELHGLSPHEYANRLWLA
jgi:transposase InsO family protein